MSSRANNTIYEEVVRISRVYLGPAAERFIDRQIKNHLDKQPENLQANDIHKLIDWIRLAVSFLTEDGDLVEEYVHQLKQIANPRQDK
ncbi:hypothetical protein BH09PAT4_BH09PAT4_05440 [soil metagenome]